MTQETKPSKTTGVISHIHSPEAAVERSLRLIQDRIDNPKTGIRQNIPGTTDFLMPLRTGELIAIVGYTSNGKSSFVNYMVTQHAYRLKGHIRDNPDYKHVILYCTWEQSIEEQTILDLSRVTSIPASKIFKGELTKEEANKIWTTGAEDRRLLPIWLVGSSVMDDRRRKRFSMEEINQILIYMEEELHFTIDMIVLDYLQRIRRTAKSNDIREGFMDIVDTAKDMTLRCPVFLLSQAGRQVKNREFQLPDLDDGQETSNLEQSCDHYYSLWMPKQSPNKKTITMDGIEYNITDDLLIVGFLKQKNGPAPIRKVYKMGYGGTYLTEATGKAVDTKPNYGKRGGR